MAKERLERESGIAQTIETNEARLEELVGEIRVLLKPFDSRQIDALSQSTEAQSGLLKLYESMRRATEQLTGAFTAGLAGISAAYLGDVIDQEGAKELITFQSGLFSGGWVALFLYLSMMRRDIRNRLKRD